MEPIIGIDFGTSNSSMAWYNPVTDQPEIIKNQEGWERTPSVVYFGKEKILVGKPALDRLEDDEEYDRVIMSVKRNLVNETPMILPDEQVVMPVDVAAQILRKLKQDAETGLFQEPVKQAVITYPAIFDALQRGKLEEAAKKAGFKKVWLLPEPVAAAKAYVHAGLKMGQQLLVYDLGGGTFDLAVLTCEEETWRVAMRPTGDRCGGDDFDRALYDYCNEIAQQKLGRPISLIGEIDLYFLHQCRKRKENLSSQKEQTFSSILLAPNGGRSVPFGHKVDRATFESRIRHFIKQTVNLTKNTLNEAKRQGYPVDTVVLIGGSSRVPLVQEQLTQTLPVKPLEWEKRDVAVALGAAIYAHEITPRPLTRTIIRRRFSLLRDKLDEFDALFEEECVKNIERFMNDDPEWRPKPDEINNCIVGATIAYTVKVKSSVQEELNNLKQKAHDFYPKSEKSEIAAAEDSATAWGFWIGDILASEAWSIAGPIGRSWIGQKYFGKYIRAKTLKKVAEVARQIQPELNVQAEGYLKEVEASLLEKIPPKKNGGDSDNNWYKKLKLTFNENIERVRRRVNVSWKVRE